MNHAQLRAFHAVASEGSFTRAAEALHVTQPTLSGQVKALEERYGVKLFDRRGRRVHPTELGRSLLDLTRRLFSLEAEAEQILGAAKGLKRGHLRLAADAPFHVIGALSAFAKRYPGIRLSLTIGNSEEILEALVEHRADVAVLANIPENPRVHAVPFRRDRLIAFVEQNHPWAGRESLTLKELAGRRLVLREIGSTTRRLFETAMAARGLTLGEVLEVNSREAVRETVAAGLGIGVVSESEFGSDRRLVPLPIEAEELAMTEYVACLSERRDLSLVRAFLDILERQVGRG
ncbi:transcriptional regulator [Hypericibacter adhaerens]|uniref:Transcriptional regulator n=1 Tax=Hypericibacter adhaerens TaxID=2602016 RepID=A0A5J6MVC1_9PROT|nr:LysR substrate-binding domain-containing protein [Hypericibacter adhaerens]QEX21618.1 transcriptional regulator [Hypericibacter adhaerens]